MPNGKQVRAVIRAALITPNSGETHEFSDRLRPDARWGINGQRLIQCLYKLCKGAAHKLRYANVRIKEIAAISENARDALSRQFESLLLTLQEELLHLAHRFISHPGDDQQEGDEQ